MILAGSRVLSAVTHYPTVVRNGILDDASAVGHPTWLTCDQRETVRIGVDAVEKCGFLISAAVFRLSCAGGCCSNPRCIDFDANWTDPIVSDFTHKMRAVGLGAQGFGAQVF